MNSKSLIDILYGVHCLFDNISILLLTLTIVRREILICLKMKELTENNFRRNKYGGKFIGVGKGNKSILNMALGRILFSSVAKVLLFHASINEGKKKKIPNGFESAPPSPPRSGLCFSYAFVANFHVRKMEARP